MAITASASVPSTRGASAASDDADPRFRGCEGRPTTPCALGDPAARPTWLIYGDSHADALAGAFDGYLRSRHAAGLLTFASGCLPVVDSGDGNCRSFNRQVGAFLAGRPDLRTVVLVSTWRQPLERGYTDAAGRIVRGDAALRAFDASFARTVTARMAGGRAMVVWMPVPGARRSVPPTLARDAQWGRHWKIGYSRAEYDRTFAFLTATLSRFPAVRLIRPAPYICSGGQCRVMLAGRPLYHDQAHPAGSQASFYQAIVTRELGAAAP